MSIKDILVFLDDSKTNADRVNIAFALARKHSAGLTGVSLESLKPMHAKSEDDKALFRMANRLAHKLVDDFTQAAQQRAMDVTTIVIAGDGPASAMKMAHYARNYDLVILSQPNPARDNYVRLIEFAQKVLIHSGRPILFMPYIGSTQTTYQKALIAWDGTPAASRAVHEAIPMLTLCEEVSVLVVASKKQIESKHDVLAERLVKHLQNHAIKARLQTINPGNNSVSGVILNQISENAIDLLVMGGHGTPTLKQKIFGGVTQTLLSSMVVPVLMSD